MTARACPRRPALLVAFGLAALAAQMPSACSRDVAVATALDAAGTVERGNAGVWRDVVPGTPFVVGDTLRTSASSRTRLALAGAGVIRVGENARLRFQQGGLAGRAVPAIGVELGSAEVEETVAPLLVLTGVGPARIEPGAHIRVHADGQTSSLEVLVGRAVMLEAGQEVALEAGHGIRIHLGSAEIQRFALTVGAAVVEPTPAVVEPTPARRTPSPSRRQRRTPEPSTPPPKSPTPQTASSSPGTPRLAPTARRRSTRTSRWMPARAPPCTTTGRRRRCDCAWRGSARTKPSSSSAVMVVASGCRGSAPSRSGCVPARRLTGCGVPATIARPRRAPPACCRCAGTAATSPCLADQP